jgi:putative nucleotidyltransferase with HDIG domain
MKILWRHNLACAVIADRIAARGPLDKEIAYTAGILHDIGRAALAVIQPGDYSALLARHQGTADSILEEERALFGLDHCEAGLQLINNWLLPSEFRSIVAHHHAAADAEHHWDMAELVKVSCRMADAVGFPAFAGCACAAYEDLLPELPQEVRTGLNPDRQVFADEIAEAIRAIELA